MLDAAIISVLEDEYIAPGKRVSAVCADIADRHKDRVQAFVYYGSSLRDMDNPDKMLDFYVLVDSYTKTHKNPIRAALNFLIPPAVYYHEMEHADGVLTTCKYSILSLKAFEAKCTSRALLSQIWGRFSQPCIVLFPQSTRIKRRIHMARAKAVCHIAEQTTPLFDYLPDPIDFWSRAFRESYRTELRPEASETRSREIVERYADRYQALFDILFHPSQTPDSTSFPAPSGLSRFRCQTKWFFRRLIGKPLGAIRVLNSAMTFDGGLDYVLRKLYNHSGVTINVTPSQRRHPILWAPVLAWKLHRRGAFR